MIPGIILWLRVDALPVGVCEGNAGWPRQCRRSGFVVRWRRRRRRLAHGSLHCSARPAARMGLHHRRSARLLLESARAASDGHLKPSRGALSRLALRSRLAGVLPLDALLQLCHDKSAPGVLGRQGRRHHGWHVARRLVLLVRHRRDGRALIHTGEAGPSAVRGLDRGDHRGTTVRFGRGSSASTLVGWHRAGMWWRLSRPPCSSQAVQSIEGSGSSNRVDEIPVDGIRQGLVGAARLRRVCTRRISRAQLHGV
mmetsp:Transcript_29798/g.77077  ORF Transcript_29798/g.77077 Transcript_29798/m.77077 type:complete len:254 (+) Transcript_29798:3-764(+)